MHFKEQQWITRKKMKSLNGETERERIKSQTNNDRQQKIYEQSHKYNTNTQYNVLFSVILKE